MALVRSKHRPENSAVGSLSIQLRELAHKRGPGAKLPTAREICMQYGASRTTLNDALDDLEAQDIVYRKQGSGIYVSSKLHCKNIHVLINASLVIPSGVSPFWGLLCGRIVAEGQKRSASKDEEIHFQLVACEPDMASLPHDVVRIIENGPVDGMLSIGMPKVIWELPKSIPMVTFAGFGHWHVFMRYTTVIAEAVRRLSQLGCRRVGYWVPAGDEIPRPGTWIFENETAQSFQQSLRDNGLPYLADLHYVGTVDASESEADESDTGGDVTQLTHQEQGYEAVMRAFSNSHSNHPDGLVITSDMMTLGALAAFRQLGIRPGVDVRIASHSNAGSPTLFGWENDILRWQVDPAEIVTEMFAFLDRLIAGEVCDEAVVVEQRFPD